jgi:glycosyltransferase involved in cell wall biosynthesis
MARIAVYVPTLAGGGAERVMLNLATGFADAGHEAILVVDRRVGAYADKVPPQVRCVDLGARKSLLAFPKLRRFVRQEQPDILLSALFINNITAAVLRRLIPGGCRVFLSEHSILSLQIQHSDAWWQRFLGKHLRRILPWADGMIVVSPGVGEDLRTAFGLKMPIHAIGNPVLPLDYAQLYAEEVYPWPPHAGPTFLGVGRLNAQKDFATLIRAFAKVRAVCPARLVILGEGPEGGALRGLAASLGVTDDVLMPGFADTVHPYYRMADVFVLSSTWEGFGNVLVEAMATETPVVSTDCPNGPAFILEDGQYGALVPVGDADAMAAAMLRALETSPEARAAARQRAEAFRIDRIAQAYLEILL